jgi:hypothetical protein
MGVLKSSICSTVPETSGRLWQKILAFDVQSRTTGPPRSRFVVRGRAVRVRPRRAAGHAGAALRFDEYRESVRDISRPGRR